MDIDSQRRNPIELHWESPTAGHAVELNRWIELIGRIEVRRRTEIMHIGIDSCTNVWKQIKKKIRARQVKK